jgi:DUF2934 family protein
MPIRNYSTAIRAIVDILIVTECGSRIALMSLLHHVRPLLELGICKEYYMARKTTGTGTPRSKKTTPPTEASAVQPAPLQVVPEVRNNVTPITLVAKKPNVDLDEEIRRRAYELYLERHGATGDPAQDWFKAEREVRARYAGQNQSALAAGQGRS